MITIVTAASSNHYKSAKQFLRSCPQSSHVIFYDIGLTFQEASDLQHEFPNVTYRLLDFTKLPDFAQLTAPHAGAYAWKPYIVHEVYNECNEGIMIWCDAGNVILDMKALENTVKHSGIYSPASAFSVEQMTHRDCLDIMRVHPQYKQCQMRNAAIVGFVCNDEVIRNFINQWNMLAMRKEIIIPETSTRNDHRWDQSILTCLMYNWDVRCTYEMIGVIVHQDCD